MMINTRDPLDLWLEELRRLRANPPAHVPEDRFGEYRAHFDRAIARVEEEKRKEAQDAIDFSDIGPGLMAGARTIMRAGLAGEVGGHVRAAGLCGVYEEREPRDFGERMRLLEKVAPGKPGPRKGLFPVPQPRTTGSSTDC